MNIDTLKTAKALEKQINAIDTFLSESCLDVEYTGIHYYIKVYMDNILSNCRHARDKMIEELEKL